MFRTTGRKLLVGGFVSSVSFYYAIQKEHFLDDVGIVRFARAGVTVIFVFVYFQQKYVSIKGLYYDV